MEQVGAGEEVASPEGFVAERPHHDAGTVAVPRPQPRFAVKQGVFPQRLIRDVLRAFAVRRGGEEAVRFHVGLVDEVEAVFVAELQKARVVGVVRGAYRVDVVGLHQLKVEAHIVGRDGAAALGVRVVAVDSAQLDRHGVDLENAAFGIDGAEADALVNLLAGGAYLKRIKLRRFRCP